MCIIKYNKNVDVGQTLNQFVENDQNEKLINKYFHEVIKSKIEFFNKFTIQSVVHVYEIIEEYLFDHIRNFSVQYQYKSNFNPETKANL